MLNIEELATIWHFPLPFVKTPLLHKSGYKRAEAPSGLPVEFSESPLKQKALGTTADKNAQDARDAQVVLDMPPEELPFG